ncbi:MAG: nickel pincer cofactor biosynthesis protein LarC [Anaerolineae bacterium]|nr:nickel pincer cofactor biosynthesis protein LarC [Anaerolineales bacterium]MCQ3980073.1 nickel pincer cofactor biosynthesis protein LarC [Anaerolineae bacterium]
MKIAYFDCFAGISGDMVIGALLELGLDPAVLEYELCKLPLEGYRLQVSRVEKCGIQTTHFQVILTDATDEYLADAEFQEIERPAETHHHHNHSQHSHPHRSLTEIIRLIQDSHLSAAVKSTACQIFTRLGQAEARVHGISLKQVHFHEVGGIDAIVDIVGAAIGLEQLGLERIYASPLHLGSGFVRCAHGLFPVPAPATVNLIAGVPVYSSAVKGELVTPTGAAIITTLAQQFGPLPAMVIQVTGYGAGSRDREIPNALRVYLGQAKTQPPE